MKVADVEFRVGIFVLFALAILSVIVFQIGGVNIFNTNMYKIYVVFDFVNGIEKDAPVHVAGVSVGNVKNITIFYDSQRSKVQVKLALYIHNDVKIPKDSLAYINTLGILGEKYIEIVPGQNRLNFLQNEEFIMGNNPVQLEKLTESLVDIVGDQTVKDSLRQSFYNLKQATEDLRLSSKAIREIIEEIEKGKGSVGKFLKDDSIYVQTEKMVANLSTKLDKMVLDLNNGLNDLVKDLKKSPWKLLRRPKNDPNEDNLLEKDINRGYIYKK